jgi:glucose-6-phosphate dehydrogenase assembly protein OpcA
MEAYLSLLQRRLSASLPLSRTLSLSQRKLHSPDFSLTRSLIAAAHSPLLALTLSLSHTAAACSPFLSHSLIHSPSRSQRRLGKEVAHEPAEQLRVLPGEAVRVRPRATAAQGLTIIIFQLIMGYI